ncbi:CAAX geranylgeranyltransferase alpha subunit [Linnemannia exigua]|uniref:Protein farnesyltransferase/geranylgeranyltransferase type-1 subunit alpha n=1 Tax=Linnemannia exigua TaxID=604196 RepID=A0AAD4HB67_9FUNG|nr:CAAX geranylgeranyltransferase alpha subunit [Linnemannia exigua]
MAEQDNMPFYQKPEWADVVPIPQDDGPNPLVPIAYTKEYSTTMDYFRAMCKTQEKSERALDLTKIVIELSPSHYTVWYYRQQLLKELNKDLKEELEWIEWMINDHPKSYQIWHHRQVVIGRIANTLFPATSTTSTVAPITTAQATEAAVDFDTLSESQKAAVHEMVKAELDVIAESLQEDTKNYHAWSYRQWVLAHFGHGPWWVDELAYTEELIAEDVRNNSAWNQRYFVVTNGKAEGVTEEDIQREVQFAKSKIEKTPSNESPWVYLTGILRKGNHPVTEIKEFCESLLSAPRANFSPFVHSTLLDIYEVEAKEQRSAASVEKAKEEAIMLAEKVDPIRLKYWNWRKAQLQKIDVLA